MDKKNLFIGILVVTVLILGSYAGFNLWQSYRWRTMGHGPTGFDEEQQIGGMPIERELEEGAFSVSLDLPEGANFPVGSSLVVKATVSSNTAPHSRVVLTFLINGKEIDSMQGLIPPYQTSEATFNWTAEEGQHKIKVVVSSAAGIVYDEDEKNISVY